MFSIPNITPALSVHVCTCIHVDVQFWVKVVLVTVMSRYWWKKRIAFCVSASWSMCLWEQKPQHPVKMGFVPLLERGRTSLPRQRHIMNCIQITRYFYLYVL